MEATTLLPGVFAVFGAGIFANLGFVACLAVIWGYTYNERDGFAITFLIVLAVWLGFLLSPETKGFWNTAGAVLWTTLVGLVQYFLWGLPAGLAMRLYDMRKLLVEMRAEAAVFVQERAKTGQMLYTRRNGLDYQGNLRSNMELLSLTDKQVDQCLAHIHRDEMPEFLVQDWRRYRREVLNIRDGEASFWKRFDKFIDLTILWPFHLLNRIIGQWIEEVIRWVFPRFRKIVDLLIRVVRIGIPNNLDT